MRIATARRAGAALLLVALAGCAVGGSTPPPSPETSAAICPDLFRQFDAIEDRLSTPTGRRDRLDVQPELVVPAQRLRAGGCITWTDGLTGLDAPAPVAVVESGPAIGPTAVHAGVVTNMNDDARVRAWFEAAGVPVRTVGSAALGRRVYLGPFATQGGVDSAAELARAAGFPGPYTVGRF